MAGIVNFPLFITASIILNVMPGPDTLYIVSRSVSQGKRAGLLSSWGLCTGALVHTLAAATGLSAILTASAQAFALVKYAGCLYLLFLGVKTFCDRNAMPEIDATPREPASGRAIFLQGVLVDILNPKVAIFFLAFLPQFIDPRTPHKFMTFVFLGLTVILFSLIWEAVLACASASFTGWLRRNRSTGLLMNRLAGVTFFGLGIKLATEEL